MSAPESDNVRVVIAALLGNLLIALSKFAAAFFSGSAATLAEAVHSVADTVNQVLLMVGLKRAARPPTYLHPFGHAVESYFWPFLVSIMIFLLGGAFAIYEGIHDLVQLATGTHDAGAHGSPLWSYGVLGTSFAFESYSFSVAFGEFRKMQKGRSVWDTLMHAKDPTIPVVLMEDTAALVGLAIALVAVALTHITGWAGCDAIGSLLIGLLLGLVAYILSSRTHSLLIGEAAAPDDRERIEAIAKETPGIVGVCQLLSMHLGPKHVLLALKVDFTRGQTLEEVEGAIDLLETRVRQEMPHMRYIFVEPDSDYIVEKDPDRPVPERGYTR